MTMHTIELRDDPVLFAEVVDNIAARPEPDRGRLAPALDERRVSAAFKAGVGHDGGPVLVLEVSVMDENGIWPFMRIDAGRFGYRLVDGEVVHGAS